MNNFIKKGLFFVPVVIVIGLFLFITRDDGGANPEAELQEVLAAEGDDKSKEDNQSHEMEFMVDVKGEVRNPGVYEMSANSRVDDVIHKAGGFTDEADQTQVNLAQKVHDEMIIIISKIGEEGDSTTSGTDDLGKIRINVADQMEIESLSGIGPSKAAAIIQYREENGLFHTVDELLEISGIGQKTLDNIKDDLIIP
ncbi:helix-hairpin-helix domain-containing protein [Virgibacillus oceani]